ncbi:uncharacterized protein [Physcomitrium patens]|uniref:Uncharacterized protein n=1 Tax=Physcomitrium patens TaxID=3218 RepID=A0A2K1KC02_PHYPA|nr:uncharacterized protein LOC112284248 [Physcomitrium patens]XP_024379669.1 uncharacterized protein LOC112284248 [Physcomitrium patens]XP_024379670.1 uncharacterized protein LOC112284248 [Physcomitrium patens]XP_024379671.1 uncharacterized protein LOC112284248 [Physcomitrium patens]PNR51299.1 hypothetical protein PHYPA_010485 [Physcomitrium patens]|eukprot:XP_024379668.1 uncharacterized protein LOC112284248 [Physcomitrella patens]
MSDLSPRRGLQWCWAGREGHKGPSSSAAETPVAGDVAHESGLRIGSGSGAMAAPPSSSGSSSATREENEAAELVLEQLDEQWFCDNVVKWPTSRPGSPPGVIDKEIDSPFRRREAAPIAFSTTQGDVASGAVKPRLWNGERSLNPPRSRLDIRRVADGEQHFRGFMERDPNPRRQTLGGEVHNRRIADLSTAQTSSLPLTPTKFVTVDHSRYCSWASNMDEFSPLARPPGPLVGVTEDEEMENGLFERMVAVRPAKLSSINPGRHSRGPLEESSSNSSDQVPIKHATKTIRRRRLKGTKSLTDLEYEELRGWKDLGFEVSKDDLTPHVVRMFPGLERQGIPPYNSPQSLSKNPAHNVNPNQNALPHNRAPPVQHLLWPRRPDSPLTNTPFLDPSIDMKGQLKSWASEMASIVSTEC